jgi:hypothetical protein
MKRWFARLRWWHCAALAAGVVVGAYILNFAPGSGGRLSQATEDWAQFGEYVGGVFALLAFAGVVYTVELQRRQLELQRQQIDQLSEQAAADELHRLCRELASNIDHELNAEIKPNERTAQALADRFLQRTARGVLELVADRPLPTNAEHASVPEALHGPSIKRSMDIAVPELDLLANCVQDSVIKGGSVVILAYYRDRYSESVRRMAVLGYPLKTADFWLANLTKSQ